MSLTAHSDAYTLLCLASQSLCHWHQKRQDFWGKNFLFQSWLMTYSGLVCYARGSAACKPRWTHMLYSSCIYCQICFDSSQRDCRRSGSQFQERQQSPLPTQETQAYPSQSSGMQSPQQLPGRLGFNNSDPTLPNAPESWSGLDFGELSCLSWTSFAEIGRHSFMHGDILKKEATSWGFSAVPTIFSLACLCLIYRGYWSKKSS